MKHPNLFLPFYQHIRSLGLCWVLFSFLVDPLMSQSVFPEVYVSSEIMEKADKALEAGRMEDALMLYQQILPQDPDYLKAQLHRDQILVQLDRPGEAITNLQRLYAEKRIVDEPDHLILLASLLIDDSLYTEADALLDEMAVRTPDFPTIHFLKASLAYNSNDNKSAFQHLMRSIDLHPDHPNSHSFMGRLCLEEGYIIEGYLALLTSILLNPDTEVAIENVRRLNVQLSSAYQTKSDLLVRKPGTDQFGSIETIFRNELPLNPKYPLHCDIDEPFTRNVQALLEYSVTHTSKGGFFETTYLPVLQVIQKNGQTETFLYYLVGGLKDVLGKKWKSHEREVAAFTKSFIQGNAWDYLGQRTIEIDGKPTPVMVYYENGYPFLKGPVKDGKQNGAFRLTNKWGQRTGDLQLKNDNLDGVQKYYYPNGAPSTTSEWKMGVQSGAITEYYYNGQVSENYTTVSGTITGPYLSYYPMGGKEVEITYSKTGKPDGRYVRYYPSGSVKESGTYVEGELEGEYKKFNAVGDLVEHGFMRKGLYDGPYTEYWNGQIVKARISYQAGLPHGWGVNYDGLGRKTHSWLAEKGTVLTDTTYTSTGSLNMVTGYSAKGDLELVEYFDLHGKLYYKEMLSKGKLTKGIQYHHSLPPKEFEIKNTTIRIKDLDGRVVLMEGGIKDGIREGEWTSRYPNGELLSHITYVGGIRNGIHKAYIDNGFHYLTFYNKEGDIDGRRRYQDLDGSFSINYFKEGNPLGPVLNYDQEGNLNYETWLDGETFVTPEITRYKNGKVKEQTRYIQKQPWTQTRYSPQGDTLLHYDHSAVTGEVTWPSDHTQFVTTCNLTNGIKNGPYRFGSKSQMIYQTTYVNGVVHGQEENRYPHGPTEVTMTQYAGLPHGTRKWYHPNGRLKDDLLFDFGTSEGTRSFYYANGTPFRSSNIKGDMLDGEEIWYAYNGQPVLALGFLQNMVHYYQVLDAKGKLGEKINVHPSDSLHIISLWPGGKRAMELHVVRSNLIGTVRILEPGGKECLERNYAKGKLHGLHKEYNEAGKLYMEVPYVTGNISGKVMLYSDSGQPEYSIDYEHGMMNGSFVQYQGGKIKQVFQFENGNLKDE